MTTATDGIRALAEAMVLQGYDDHSRPPGRPIDETEDLWSVAANSRLAGLISIAIEAGLVAGASSDDPAVDFRIHHLERALVVERSLVHAVTMLARAGVRPIVLKGVAVAHLDYPDPAIRTFGDVDLLVHPSEIDRAVRVLTDAGGQRDLPPRTQYWDREFAKDIPIVDRFGVVIDVHRTLDRGAFGAWIDLDELHRSTESFVLGGLRMRALDPIRRAMHAAYSLTVSETDPRLAHAIDLHLSARKIESPAQLVALARRWRAGSVLADAIAAATTLTGTAPVAADGRPLQSAANERSGETAARASYRTRGGSNVAELAASWRAIAGLQPRIRFARGLVMPSRRYRRARRAAGRPSEARAAISEAVRRTSRRWPAR